LVFYKNEGLYDWIWHKLYKRIDALYSFKAWI